MPAANLIGIRQLGKNLREAYVGEVKKNGQDEGEKKFKENVSKLHKKIGSGSFSFRGLAEGIMGENWSEKYRLGCLQIQRGIHESVSAVDVSSFSNITGQILIDHIRDNYASPEFISDAFMETIPVRNGNLGPDLQPWLSIVKDPPSILLPQQEYPATEFIEQFITLIAPEKRGLKCMVSMEMIYADKTKQAVDRANSVGYRLRLDKEERCIKVIAGFPGYNNFTYMGTNYNTYGGSGLWVNSITGNTILNYQGIASLELAFANMLDLATGKPIMVNPKNMKILCTPYKIPELKIAFHAAQTHSGDYETDSASNAMTDYNGVPLINDVNYPIIKSQVLWYLLTSPAPVGLGLAPNVAKEWIIMGDFARAFYYREVIPFRTEQAPPGNPEEFNQDIVVQVKAMEWGAPGVQGPQNVLKSVNA